jgi:hypothetical protein
MATTKPAKSVPRKTNAKKKAKREKPPLTAKQKNQAVEGYIRKMNAFAAEQNWAMVRKLATTARPYADSRERKRLLEGAYEAALDGMTTTIMQLSPYDLDSVQITVKTMSLDIVLRRLKDRAFDLAPAFQRKAGLWNRKKRSQFIESFLIQLPTQPIYVQEDYDGRFIVIDGLQRLSTLSWFCLEGGKLAGLEYLAGLDKYKYDQLPKSLRRKLVESQMMVVIVGVDTPDNVKFNIFKRLNTGGLTLSGQEMRTALYQGPAVDLLKDMADNQHFIAATDNGISSNRQADLEYCLRWCAFWLTGPDGYERGDMNSYLNGTMQHINGMTQEDQRELVADFDRAMKAAANVWGKLGFRKPKEDGSKAPVSKALFDSFGYAFGLMNGDDTEALTSDKPNGLVTQVLGQALDHQDYEASVTRSTKDVKAVQLRFTVAQNVLAECLSATMGTQSSYNYDGVLVPAPAPVEPPKEEQAAEGA